MKEKAFHDRLFMSQLGQPEGLYSFIGFLIWPFGITLDAFRNWDRPWSKNVFWLFCIFFGSTFVIADTGGADSARYASQLIQFAHSDMGLKELWNSFYSEGSEYADIVSPLIMFLLSRITDNPSVLFIIFSIVFGYFYSRNIWYILDRVNGRISIVIILYLVTFILINPIWNINAFRFSAAAQIFLFGTLPYLFENKKKHLIWSGLSVLLHFTFLFPLAVLGLYILLRNRLNLYLVFFILSSFIKEIDLHWIQSILTFLPDVLFSEVLIYTNVEYAENRMVSAQELPWFITYSSAGIRWVVYLIIASSFFFGRVILKERSDLRALLSFSLLFFSFANILSLIPSGGRFITVANTFIFPYFIVFLATVPEIGRMVMIRVLSIPILFLFCLVNIRIGMSYFSIITIIGNPITAVLYSDPISFITEIKRLF